MFLWVLVDLDIILRANHIHGASVSGSTTRIEDPVLRLPNLPIALLTLLTDVLSRHLGQRGSPEDLRI